MNFSRVYSTCLLLGALLGLSAALPANASPENTLKMLGLIGKGIVGNPAQVFMELFKSLSGVLVIKMNEPGLKWGQKAEKEAERDEVDEDKWLPGELVDAIVNVANKSNKQDRREDQRAGGEHQEQLDFVSRACSRLVFETSCFLADF